MPRFRYTGRAVITVYTKKVDEVRKASQALVELGRQGIVLAGEDYDTKMQYLFTRLNELKPAMIEEATRLGAQAIVGVKFDYSVIGQGGSMMMVAVSGTAVTLT